MELCLSDIDVISKKISQVLKDGNRIEGNKRKAKESVERTARYAV